MSSVSALLDDPDSGCQEVLVAEVYQVAQKAWSTKRGLAKGLVRTPKPYFDDTIDQPSGQ